MLLDDDICERARLARDARFDGRFYTGVVTTGVYCRPVCPARQPQARNVRYFPSAAAASEAGFRPCLRCRPEASPGTPAWLGTETTVSRALRLIAAGALDDGDVGALAERLGIGARHLARLFNRHLGAPPRAVAQTRRLLFAKKLIDETGMAMAAVACAAGFGSVRRFNAVFRACYGRAPGDLRRTARRRDPSDGMRLRLAFRPPYDWPSLIAFLALRAIPGVERVTPDCYARTIALDGARGAIEVRPVAGAAQLELRVACSEPGALIRVVERVRRIFDLGADPAEIAGHLGRDAALAPLVAARPGLRLPGAWHGFELAVRAILGQQVTVKGASTLAGRLVAAFGEAIEGAGDGLSHLFPTPEALATADVAAIGMPGARARAIEGLARAVRDGRVGFDAALGLDRLTNELTALDGIGAWTAHYIAMRAGGEPDAFPASDLGLLRAAARLGIAGGVKGLSVRAEAWRPWRAYAAMHLWRSEADAPAAPRGAARYRGEKVDVLHAYG